MQPSAILRELFPAFADFMESAPSVDSQITFQTLNASALSTRKTISDIVTMPIWQLIAAQTDTDALVYLRSAWANLTMYKHRIFTAVNNRMEKKGDTYKYELEGMKRQYIDNYHNAMDSLLHILESDASYSWASSVTARQISGLKIKNVLDFQQYYYIDTSYLYFIRTVPIQKKELLLTFDAYYQKIADRPDLIENINYALVYTIIGKSLQQFDIIEFPPTIRNYFDDNTLSRNGKDEHNAVMSLADSLLSDAGSLLDNVDIALTDATADIYTGSNLNNEENKYYGMF